MGCMKAKITEYMSYLGGLARAPLTLAGIMAFVTIAAMTSTPVRASEGLASGWQELSPNAHLFTMDGSNTVVVVGRGEALVMDTYTEAQAKVLKEQIRKRFDVPVRYVVYSHAHADHLRGSAVFGDKVEYVAQQRQLDRLNFLIPFEPSIHRPTRFFDKSLTLEVGGVTVMLEDYGFNHGTGVTVMRIPEAKAVVIPDIVYPQRLLWYGLNDYSPRGILATLRAINATEYEIVVPTHGPTFGRAEVTEFIGFLTDLIDQVKAVIDANLESKGPEETLSIALKEVDLTRYDKWGNYKEWRDGNVEGTFQSLYVGW
ncbi:glyoxylase-like metal-dependent hydrolase (beta-lactamase superfamily II) [Pseudomonas sp. TE3911]|jgi:glyoxylase-like metal-dependent hydrolase (beta-lactamase superfamily II)